jgi:hypothetical protein
VEAEILRTVARAVSVLAQSTALDRESDPRRVLPEIAPAALWRTLPALLRACAPFMESQADRDFARRLARMIENRESRAWVGAGWAVQPC